MMTLGALDLAFGLAPFSFGAHLDYSRVPCDECAVVHDVFGLSLGFVFVRVLVIFRFRCEANE
jgi:hypothetical protein